MILEEVEEIELKYLKKYYYFLKFLESELIDGFKSASKIRDDWQKHWDGEDKGISSFSVGFERVIYSYFNGNEIGLANSSPVASDLFFETKDAFIHIDVKTVQVRNIGDFTNHIFIGDNQNNYKEEIKQSNGNSFNPKRFYNPALPKIYNQNKANSKICLTYFLTILYNDETLDILNINLISMPNGLLSKTYNHLPLKAGKNINKVRFNFSKTANFKLLAKKPSRIEVIHFNKNMDNIYKKKLKFFENLIRED